MTTTDWSVSGLRVTARPDTGPLVANRASN